MKRLGKVEKEEIAEEEFIKKTAARVRIVWRFKRQSPSQIRY